MNILLLAAVTVHRMFSNYKANVASSGIQHTVAPHAGATLPQRSYAERQKLEEEHYFWNSISKN